MDGRRIEHRHHTDEQVREIIEKAARLVGDLAVAEDLRVPAFQAAAGLYAQKSITQEVTPLGVPALAIPQGR